MLKQFWAEAHAVVLSDLIDETRPTWSLRYISVVAGGLLGMAAASALEIHRSPGAPHILLPTLLVLLCLGPVHYAVRLLHYPAVQSLQQRQENAELRKRLYDRTVSETCIVALAEYLCDFTQLRDEDVRTGPAFADWMKRCQTSVEGAYVTISRGLSNEAAMAFVAYPVSDVRYVRGSFNDEHAKWRSILEKYVVKLSVIVNAADAMRQPALPRPSFGGVTEELACADLAFAA